MVSGGTRTPSLWAKLLPALRFPGSGRVRRGMKDGKSGPAARASGVVAAAVARAVESSSSATWNAVRFDSGRKMLPFVTIRSAGADSGRAAVSMFTAMMPTLLPRSWVIIR